MLSRGDVPGLEDAVFVVIRVWVATEIIKQVSAKTVAVVPSAIDVWAAICIVKPTSVEFGFLPY